MAGLRARRPAQGSGVGQFGHVVRAIGCGRQSGVQHIQRSGQPARPSAPLAACAQHRHIATDIGHHHRPLPPCCIIYQVQIGRLGMAWRKVDPGVQAHRPTKTQRQTPRAELTPAVLGPDASAADADPVIGLAGANALGQGSDQLRRQAARQQRLLDRALVRIAPRSAPDAALPQAQALGRCRAGG